MKKYKDSLILVPLVIVEMLCLYSGLTKDISFFQKEFTFGLANPTVAPLWLLMGIIIPFIMGLFAAFDIFEEKNKTIQYLIIVFGLGILGVVAFNEFM